MAIILKDNFSGPAIWTKRQILIFQFISSTINFIRVLFSTLLQSVTMAIICKNIDVVYLLCFLLEKLHKKGSSYHYKKYQNFKTAIKPLNEWPRDFLTTSEERNGHFWGSHNSSTFLFGHYFNDFLKQESWAKKERQGQIKFFISPSLRLTKQVFLGCNEAD